MVVVGFMLSLSSNALGQVPLTNAPEEESMEEELKFLKEESVSIAVRHEQPISQAPSNVYVITDEDIRNSGSIDLPTILRRIPGMEVIQMTGADFDVSVRGDNQPRANKLLVLVDGRSIYLDIQGEVLWKAIPVTLPEIKRIEVLKGPASALYGFNAFDGVVNIITKSAAEMKGTTLQVGGGEFGTFMTSAIQAGTVGKFGYRLSVGEDQTNQWRNRDALAFRSYKFNLDTSYALSETSSFRFSGGLLDSNRFDGPSSDVAAIAQRPIIGYANAVYERPNFFLRAWYTHVDQDDGVLSAFPTISRFFQPFADRSLNPRRLQKWDSYNIESQHALEFGSTNRFTYGFNYRHNAFSSNGLNQYTTEDRLGFYI